MIAVLWAYEGWQFVTYCAGETVNPQKDFPRALGSSVVFLTGVYLLANFAYLAALGPARAAESERIAATSIATVLGPSAAKLVALTILISVFTAINSVSLTAPRVFFAMASDGLFFRKLAEVHPRFHTPAFAVVVLGAWSAILSCMGKFQELVNYTMFVAWIFYGLGAASVFPYRHSIPLPCCHSTDERSGDGGICSSLSSVISDQAINGRHCSLPRDYTLCVL
jgi:basic amino acid/polyamine antiporter, APA family